MELSLLTPRVTASLVVTSILMVMVVTRSEVTSCNDERCGYGTESHNGTCNCIEGFADLRKRKSYSDLKYCLKVCSESNRSCSTNTTCVDEGRGHRCYCKECYKRSANGHCVENINCTKSLGTRENKAESEKGLGIQRNPSQATGSEGTARQSAQQQIIGLSVGVGGSVLLIVAVIIAVVCFRKNRLSRKQKHAGSTLESEDVHTADTSVTTSPDNPAYLNTARLQPAYSGAAGTSGQVDDDSTLKSGTHGTSQVGNASVNQYELVDEVYSSCRITDAYSNRTDSVNKMKENAWRKQIQDDYGTLYDVNVRSANRNATCIQSGSPGSDKRKSAVAVNTEKDSDECQYDHLRLQKA